MADTLVLNADGHPVSLLPPSTIQWKEAITYMWLDKVNVLEWYDDWIVSSARWETRVPAIIMLKQMYRRRSTPRFSKYNCHLRDKFVCQYCSNTFSKQDLTLDHVIPISLGGKTSWDNIVSACNPCNSTKGSKLIKPKNAPYQPSYYELANNRKMIGFENKHPSWETFLK